MLLSRFDLNDESYLLLDGTPGSFDFPWQGFLIALAICLVYFFALPDLLAFAILAGAFMLIHGIFWLAPHRCHAVASDGLYEYIRQFGKERIGRHLAERDALTGITVEADSAHRKSGAIPAWTPVLHVRGQSPIKLNLTRLKKEEALEAAREAAHSLSVSVLEQAPGSAPATTLRPGNLLVLQLESELETTLNWAAYGPLLLALLQGSIWLVLQAGLGGSSVIFGKITLGLLGVGCLFWIIRGRLEDFVVLDLATRRLIFIRRFAGYEKQTVCGSLDDVLEATLDTEVEHSKHGSTYYYRPVLLLRTGKQFVLGDRTEDPGDAVKRAEEVARAAGCLFHLPEAGMTRRLRQGQVVSERAGPTSFARIFLAIVLAGLLFLLLQTLYLVIRMALPAS